MFRTESPLLLRLVWGGAGAPAFGSIEPGCLFRASIDVEALDDCSVVLSIEDFSCGEVDFGPALVWARGVTREGCPLPPSGWFLECCAS